MQHPMNMQSLSVSSSMIVQHNINCRVFFSFQSTMNKAEWIGMHAQSWHLSHANKLISHISTFKFTQFSYPFSKSKPFPISSQYQHCKFNDQPIERNRQKIFNLKHEFGQMHFPAPSTNSFLTTELSLSQKNAKKAKKNRATCKAHTVFTSNLI